jgi:endonuclease I
MVLMKTNLDSVFMLLNETREKIIDGQNYYQEEKDRKLAGEYYSAIDFGQNPADLTASLNSLISDTHINQLPYNSATRNMLYCVVDLRMDGNLKSIYSGKIQEPEQVIKEDFEAEASRREMFSFMDEGSFDSMDVIYNCEHVVPQSWFGKRNPMRGDLHHLFTCEKNCNSLRSNHPYFDFDDYVPVMDTEVIKSQCGKYEEGKFEPESGKGEAARAALYFLLRYPGEIGQYTVCDVDMLLRWHKEHPVTLYEKRRNLEIHQIQQNRNPLIDFPELAGQIDFTINQKRGE